MPDIRKVRDEVLDALAGLPVAAAWLYEPFSQQPEIAVAILPSERITGVIRLELGNDLRWTARTQRFITYLPECSPALAEIIVTRGALIMDRDPVLRQQFVASMLARAADSERERGEIARGLEELRRDVPAK